MLLFLKLGGSLITDKTRPYTPRPERLKVLAAEISTALRENPDTRLVLGHGSGSFGHHAASLHDTRRGVDGPGAWYGFSEVWYQASALNRMVIESLREAGLPAVTFSPLSSITAHDGKVFIWDLYPLRSALEQGLLPVVHGDVAFDDARGGTILSTEDIFEHLGREMHPNRILLAGLEKGVWRDFPTRKRLIPEITPTSFSDHPPSMTDPVGADVTGGMHAKITQMLALVEQVEGLEVLIFSGEEPGNVQKALAGENPGTRLHR
jgi:isopentenyl phosphate kinase